MMISKEQYNQLLRFIGWGDLENADLIVLGNEEGTGGHGGFKNGNERNEFFTKFVDEYLITLF